jgi:hypothetical protein
MNGASSPVTDGHPESNFLRMPTRSVPLER